MKVLPVPGGLKEHTYQKIKINQNLNIKNITLVSMPLVSLKLILLLDIVTPEIKIHFNQLFALKL